MSLSSKVLLAQTLSSTSHAGQRYGIENYFDYHICGVVESLKIHDLPEEFLIVGYLHDIVEDTTVTLDTIENLFDTTIRDAVDAITKRKDESRPDYLVRCTTNKIARLVKLHDAMFNATNCHKNKNDNKFSYYLQTISKLTL